MGNRDPYEILGVSRGASRSEISNAYHSLVRKYHPDKYQGNPLSDLAEEKLRDVNWAYETLLKSVNQSAASSASQYSYGTGGYTYGGSSYSGTQSDNSPIYNQIRVYINSGNFSAAQQMLAQNRAEDAEWYFLNGVSSFKNGQIAEGLQDVQRATQLDPGNPEYQNAYTQMESLGDLYQSASFGRGYTTYSPFCLPLPFCLCC